MAHRVLHVERGFYMAKNYAEQVMRDHCTITWEIPGQTIRDATDEERMSMRAEQAQEARLREARSGILGRNELPNLHFQPPATTSYIPPREAYEEMEEPLGVRVCRWPRRSRRNPNDFALKAA